MHQHSLSVIIPVLNEADIIKTTICRIDTFLKNRFTAYEIIVFDDASTDNTFALVSALAQEMPQLTVLRSNKNYGKGRAVKESVMAARYDFILFLDADLSTPIEEVDQVFRAYKNTGADIIIGSRNMPNAKLIKRQRLYRQLMGKTFNFFLQLILFRGIKDTQCGFKCFKRAAARALFQKSRINGFCFDAEILFLAKKHGLSIQCIPIHWTNREESRVKIIQNSAEMFIDLMRIRLYDLSGRYE